MNECKSRAGMFLWCSPARGFAWQGGRKSSFVVEKCVCYMAPQWEKVRSSALFCRWRYKLPWRGNKGMFFQIGRCFLGRPRTTRQSRKSQEKVEHKKGYICTWNLLLHNLRLIYFCLFLISFAKRGVEKGGEGLPLAPEGRRMQTNLLLLNFLFIMAQQNLIWCRTSLSSCSDSV